GSALRKARAQLAPPKPPPTTTTGGPAPCDSEGRGNADRAAAPAAADLMNCLRVARVSVMSIPPRSLAKEKRRPFGPPLPWRSGDLQVVVLQRERADALAGGPEVGVEDGRRGNQDGRLTDAAPRGVAARHDDRFHL